VEFIKWQLLNSGQCGQKTEVGDQKTEKRSQNKGKISLSPSLVKGEKKEDIKQLTIKVKSDKMK